MAKASGGRARRKTGDATRGKYRIGTVAGLTGLSTHTIRAWEQRYGTVAPARSEGGLRLYSEADVTRLQIIKALTERGEAIGLLAGLSDDALRARLERHAESARAAGPEAPAAPGSAPTATPLRIAVGDPRLPEQLRASPTDAAGLEVAVAATAAEALARALPGARADVLVVHLDLLGPAPVGRLEEWAGLCGARVAVVLYDFAPRRRLVQLADWGAKLVRHPVAVATLRRAVEDWLAIRQTAPAAAEGAARARAAALPPAEVPERRFSDAQLARLREIRSSVDCECPNHLSGLVASLAAFEAYSRQCEMASETDAELHATLARGTGRARALVEQLLAHLCEHDGIRL